MRLKVLVPSEEYRNYAGARIRYGRLQPALERLGFELILEDIASFTARDPDCDVLLISKCHDARAIIAAAVASDQGCAVGADIFDDYFSQFADSRLVRFRSWLGQLLPHCHFALCSTPLLSAVVKQYRADIATHVINDPGDSLPGPGLVDVLTTKLRRAQDEQRLRLAWFGMGDNPYFRVGLHDLCSYGAMLSLLGNSGMDVELTVLTNARALDADGLASIAQLPVRTSVEEWSELRERELLDQAFAAFLPVNAQGFSAAKSLNRAVTALSAGCQVISVGYPLYEPLGGLIYRDLGDFLSGVRSGSMRLSPATLQDFSAVAGTVASPEGEAAKLGEFLRALEPGGPGERGPLTLIHGLTTSSAAHNWVKALDGFSVATPHCRTPLEYDVVFRGGAGGLQMLISKGAAHRLPTDQRRRLRPRDDRDYFELPRDGVVGSRQAHSGRLWEDPPLPFLLATYPSVMKEIKERMELAFGPSRLIVSEISTLPFTPGD